MPVVNKVFLEFHDVPENPQGKYKCTSKLATRFLCIPATSAPVESVFSVAGKIFRPDRARLSDTVFHSIVFAKCNWNVAKMTFFCTGVQTQSLVNDCMELK